MPNDLQRFINATATPTATPVPIAQKMPVPQYVTSNGHSLKNTRITTNTPTHGVVVQKNTAVVPQSSIHQVQIVKNNVQKQSTGFGKINCVMM